MGKLVVTPYAVNGAKSEEIYVIDTPAMTVTTVALTGSDNCHAHIVTDGQGTWVTEGFTSTDDGATWTAVPETENLGPLGSHGIIWNGVEFVTINTNTSKNLTSPDGVTWTEIATSYSFATEGPVDYSMEDGNGLIRFGTYFYTSSGRYGRINVSLGKTYDLTVPWARANIGGWSGGQGTSPRGTIDISMSMEGSLLGNTPRVVKQLVTNGLIMVGIAPSNAYYYGPVGPGGSELYSYSANSRSFSWWEGTGFSSGPTNATVGTVEGFGFGTVDETDGKGAFNCAVWADDRFIAGGRIQMPFAEGGGRIAWAESTDGKHWVIHQTTEQGALIDCCYDGDYVYFTGMDEYDTSGETPFIWRFDPSDDSYTRFDIPTTGDGRTARFTLAIACSPDPAFDRIVGVVDSVAEVEGNLEVPLAGTIAETITLDDSLLSFSYGFSIDMEASATMTASGSPAVFNVDPIVMQASATLADPSAEPVMAFSVPFPHPPTAVMGVNFREPVYNATTQPGGVKRPYRVVVRDSAGNRYGELANFYLGRIKANPLHEIPTASVTLRNDEPTAELLSVPSREVEIWRGATKIPMDFVVLKGEGDENVTTWQLRGIPWYFTRRHFGRADRTNMLINPDFEQADMAYWTKLRTSATRYLDFERMNPNDVVSTTDQKLAGSRAMRYIQADTPLANNFVFQDVIVKGGERGKHVTFSAWVYVASAFWIKPNYRVSGLLLARMPYTSPAIPDNPGFVNLADKKRSDYSYYYTSGPFGTNTYRNLYGSLKEYRTTRIDGQHVQDKWVRHVIELDIPPNTTEVLHCRFEGPIGMTFYDGASLTADEAFTNLDKDGDDQAQLVKRMVMHAQGYVDDGSGGFDFDPSYVKSDLGIVPVVANTGVKRFREYRYADHAPIYDAINEFPTLYDGLEWSVVCTPNSRRFYTHFPRKGIKHPLVFELGGNGLITKFGFTIDGDSTSNVVIVLGLGNDSGREEGFASDLDALGGLTLETIYNATPGSSIATLDEQALRGLLRYKNPVEVVQLTITDPTGHVYNSIVEGNWHRVKINRGVINIDGLYRILQKELDPNTESIILTVNEIDWDARA